MASERFEMRVSTELMAKIDELRGHEPRASFIKRVLEEYAAGMAAPQVLMPPSSPVERREMEKVLDGGDVRVVGGSVSKPQTREAPSGKPYELPKIAKRKA